MAASLEEQARRYQELLAHTTDAVAWVRVTEDARPERRYVFEEVNAIVAMLSGLVPADFAGRTPHEVLGDVVGGSLVAEYGRAIETGKAHSWEREYPWGKVTFFIQTLAVPITAPDGTIRNLVTISRDLTQFRKTERALLQAQKLESLGVLAGGIAHDFNNLLAAMLGNVSLASAELPATSSAHAYLHDVEVAIRRAADLTRQMLAYAGKGRFVVKALDLNATIREVTQLVASSIPKKIAIHYDLAKELPAIEADAVQLQQVVMNLVINAAEAMGDAEGIVTIATVVQSVDAEYLAQNLVGEDLRAGPHVVLQVSDTGCGMTPETVARIFDPFFTTKFSGRGLGLSALLGIVRGHRGAIKIYTEVGKGTSFKVFLPAIDGPAVARETGSARAEIRPSKAVLLVDDEEALRGTTVRMLRALGFSEVIEASNGTEAFERFRARPDDIELVVLDLTMPKMDGREAFRLLRQIRPDVRVIISSGYNQADTVHQFVGTGLAGFLQKPYALDELRAAVARALAKHPGA